MNARLAIILLIMFFLGSQAAIALEYNKTILTPLDVALPTTEPLPISGKIPDGLTGYEAGLLDPNWQVFDHPTVATKAFDIAQRNIYWGIIVSEWQKSLVNNKYLEDMFLNVDLEKIFMNGDKFEIVINPSDKYAVSIIMPSILGYSKVVQEEILNKALVKIYMWNEDKETYKELKKVQEVVLDSFSIIAPNLYAIFNNDEILKNHVKIAYTIGIGAELSYSNVDGLPIIAVPLDSLNLSHQELLFIMGHELSHYIHLDATRPDLSKDIFPASLVNDDSVNLKIKAPLDFKETFENASSRIREYDADRSSVLDFGTSPDAGIAWLSRKSAYKNTFQYSHPQALNRIKELEKLKNDIEVGNIKVRAPIVFDWLSLAQEYKLL